MAREVVVVVLPVCKVEALGCFFLIAGQKAEHIVRAIDTCLVHQRKIRRNRATIRSSRSFFVRERRREVISRDARTGEHVTIVVRTIFDVILGRNRLDLLFVESNAFKVTEGNETQAVTAGTNVLVDLEATLQLCTVIGAKQILPAPILCLGHRRVAGSLGCSTSECGYREGGSNCGQCELTHLHPPSKQIR